MIPERVIGGQVGVGGRGKRVSQYGEEGSSYSLNRLGSRALLSKAEAP